MNKTMIFEQYQHTNEFRIACETIARLQEAINEIVKTTEAKCPSDDTYYWTVDEDGLVLYPYNSEMIDYE